MRRDSVVVIMLRQASLQNLLDLAVMSLKVRTGPFSAQIP
jgi:hypothetical protein